MERIDLVLFIVKLNKIYVKIVMYQVVLSVLSLHYGVFIR